MVEQREETICVRNASLRLTAPGQVGQRADQQEMSSRGAHSIDERVSGLGGQTPELYGCQDARGRRGERRALEGGGADLGSKPDKRAEGRRRRDRIEAVEKGLRVKTRQMSGS